MSKGLEVVCEPTYTVGQTADIEVDAQGQLVLAQDQVGDRLRVVNVGHSHDGLHLDNDASLHQQINSIPHNQSHSVVDDRNGYFGLYSQPALTKLVSQACLVCA